MIFAMISPGKEGLRFAPALRAVSREKWMWGMSRYQWLVFFAAWLGWGFDVFDGLLFFVAPVCVPSLLGVVPGEPGGAARVTAATGAITASLLVGWATGGVLFGFLTHRLRRPRQFRLAHVPYSRAPAAPPFPPARGTPGRPP